MNKIKPFVFWPPFLLCAAAIALSWQDNEKFIEVMQRLKGLVIDNFGWLVTLSSFGMLVLCAAIFVSPFGKTTLGGPQAKKLLSNWQMFTVVLTTNIAAGILFWCVFEPVSYLSNPPLGIEKGSPAAAQFAISTVYLHWTVIPYSIPSMVGLMFAFAYYNMRRPFSLGAPLSPLLGKHGEGWIAQAIDAVCLYCLVAALGAALGGSSMLMARGIHHVFGIEGEPTALTLALIIGAIMGTSVFAAISGVTKGIRHIANYNTAFLVGFLALVFVLGPMRFILNFAVEGLGQFLGQFFQKALFTGAAHNENWPHSWTQMLFYAFFAWAPIMGVFLGRIAQGYTVKAFLFFNVILPALFTGTWMAIICGAVVDMENKGADLKSMLVATEPQEQASPRNVGDTSQNTTAENGSSDGKAAPANETANPGKKPRKETDPTKVLFAFLGKLQFVNFLVPILLITAFLSFVTTADGNTDAMSNISTRGISPEHSESGMIVKIAWGSLMAVFCWVMTTNFGLDGIRLLSDLGGFPALFLCLAVAVSAIKVMANPARYDQFHPDYHANKTTKGHETNV